MWMPMTSWPAVMACVCACVMMAGVTGCASSGSHERHGVRDGGSVNGSRLHDVQEQAVTYEHEGVKMRGVIFAPVQATANRRTPGVLVVHEWWGRNEYALGRAKRIAQELGYVTMAVDMYGDAKTTQAIPEAMKWSSEVYGKPLMAQRAQAALDALARDGRVDTNNVAILGYCFGGTTSIELAYSGADLKGAISFHGTPGAPTPAQAAQTKAALLILTGAADPMYNAQARTALADGLNQTGLRWDMVVYGQAVHSFTNPAAAGAGLPGVAYNQHADEDSWRQMAAFLKRCFGK